MDKLQRFIWEELCQMDGETVARLFTNYYGNQLLDEKFLEFCNDEGAISDITTADDLLGYNDDEDEED